MDRAVTGRLTRFDSIQMELAQLAAWPIAGGRNRCIL